jgi:hypothetical protein
MGTTLGDPNDEETAKDWVKEHITALLIPRPLDTLNFPMKDHIYDNLETLNEELDYNWQPQKDYFPDHDDPRRVSFVHDFSGMDYCIDANMNFSDSETQRAYRRWQLANQVHHCCFTCWKYNLFKGNRSSIMKCRFCMPVHIESVSRVEVVRQEEVYFKRRKRKRIRYHPPRSNGHLNPCIKSPLLALGHGGNHDCQRISSVTGAAEYIAMYNTKQEDPDFRVIDNLYVNKISNLKRLKGSVDELDHLRAAANAVCSAQHIGTVQAAYTLLNLPFVQSSRKVITMNCERRSEMTRSIIFKKKDLDQLEPAASAELKGYESSIGRRDAYYIFMTQQRNLPTNTDRECHVSLFALFTSFSVRAKLSKETVAQPDLILLDDKGFIANPHRFCIDGMVFTVNRRKTVINMSPFRPVDLGDEKFCRATLLLHVPWPLDGEDAIVSSSSSAVETLNQLLNSDNIPVFLRELLKTQEQSQAHYSGLADDFDENTTTDGEADAQTTDLHADDDHIETAFPGVDAEGDDEYLEQNHTSDELLNFATEMEKKEREDDKRGNKSYRKHVRKISKRQYAEYESFIDRKKQEYMTKYAAANQLVQLSNVPKRDDFEFKAERKVNVDNFDNRLKALEKGISDLKGRQLNAFKTATSHISGSINNQLIMFMSGEGGTGKSKVIKLLVEHTMLHFGRQKGFYGAAVAMAPTGSASKNIHGFTWQSILRKGTRSSLTQDLNPTHKTRQAIGKDLHGVRLIVIDEVSMLSCKDLEVVETRFRLAILTTISNEAERNARSLLPFGGVHVVFGGDFYQLPPVGSHGLYITNQTKGREMWVKIVSSFVYLKHNFRLVDKIEGTRELAQCLSNVRVGRVTQDALHVLNCRVAVSEKSIENKTADRGCLWLASRNKDVVLRNEMCFKSLIRDENQEFFRFFSTHHQEQPDGVELSTHELHIRECKLRGKTSTDLLQPILDVAIGSRVRVVRNRASVVGIFNGALGTVVDFCFVGKIPTARVQPKTYGGEQPLAVILVQMDDVDIGCVGEAPRVVAFAPFLDEETALHIEGGRKFYRKQFPLECAHASTIHKAQGITLTNKDAAIVIDEKSIFMGGTYVAISRVTELESLHLTRAVTSKHFTSHDWMRRQVAAEYERLQAFHIPVDEDDGLMQQHFHTTLVLAQRFCVSRRFLQLEEEASHR